MSPLFYALVASLLFPHRWWLLAVAVLSFAALFAALTFGSHDITVIAGGLAGPAIAIPCALFCACIGFHPERRSLRRRSNTPDDLPPQMKSGPRWCASLLLFMFLVAGAVAWPLLALDWL